MAHHVHFASDGTVLEMWAGHVSLQEWIDHESMLLQRLDWNVPRQTVCDISRADLSAFDAEGVAECLSIYAPYREQMRDARVAVVARRGFSGNESYVNQARQLGITVITFYERFASACQWIGTPCEAALAWRNQVRDEWLDAEPVEAPKRQLDLLASH